MNILKLIFNNQTNNDLTSSDINNIKSLVGHLNAVIDFLHTRKKISDELASEFKINHQAISRILRINGLAVYLKKHITNNEIKSLLNIINLSNEILKMGVQEHFLSNKEQQSLHLQKLIQGMTRNHTRWI